MLINTFLLDLSIGQLHITITGLIIVTTVLLSIYAERNPQVKANLVFNPYMVKNRNEYYRLLSSGFIHDGEIHLIFNMMTLYFFGDEIEYKLLDLFGAVGILFYILFYASAIIIANLPRYFRYLNNHHQLVNALGASGGVSAILLASILFNPYLGVGLLFIPIAIPGFIFAVLYIFYSAYMDKHGKDNIGHDAHLYGALYGILFAILIDFETVPRFVEYIMSGKFFSF